MALSHILGISATWAAVFAGLFSVIALGGMRVAPDAMLQDYPESVRKEYGKPQSARGRLVASIMGILLLLAFVGCTVGGVFALRGAAGGDIGFWPAFCFGAVLVVFVHLVDLVVIDWLVIGLLRPASILLPGTPRDHPAFDDHLYHVRVLFPRPVPWPILFIPIAGLLVAGVTVALEAIF